MSKEKQEKNMVIEISKDYIVIVDAYNFSAYKLSETGKIKTLLGHYQDIVRALVKIFLHEIRPKESQRIEDYIVSIDEKFKHINKLAKEIVVKEKLRRDELLRGE